MFKPSNLRQFHGNFCTPCVPFFAVLFSLFIALEGFAAPRIVSPFIAPNEPSVQDLLPILDQAQPGAYVAVGTERGFMTASLSDKITRLVLIDNDRSINYYNEINIALIKAAKTREEYLQLRLSSSVTGWDHLQTYGLDMKKWLWWNEHVILNQAFKYLHRAGNVDPVRLGYEFANANYLFLDENFARVKKLADADQISVVNINLTDKRLASVLKSETIGKNTRLSVLDISNAWQSMFMDDPQRYSALKSFTRAGDTHSILVVSSPRRAYDTVGLITDHSVGLIYWFYLGLNLRDIKRFGLYDLTIAFKDIRDRDIGEIASYNLPFGKTMMVQLPEEPSFIERCRRILTPPAFHN